MREIKLPYEALLVNMHLQVFEELMTTPKHLPFHNTEKHVRLVEATEFAVQISYDIQQITNKQELPDIQSLDAEIRKICNSKGIRSSVINGSGPIRVMKLSGILRLPEQEYLNHLLVNFSESYQGAIDIIESYKIATEYDANLLKTSNYKKCITARINAINKT